MNTNPVSSAHTKHSLEALHPNIAVFRHPDHVPDVVGIHNSLATSLQNLTLDSAGINKLPGDALRALYGNKGETVLYWAHHEKLCLIDGRIAFMGGLDMCFGRWDTNQHALADVHPSDLSQIVFPGQDYNNARVLDFQNVSRWEENQVDRKQTGRMGWSDISICLRGPAVEDLRRHFVERWNYIYDTKYRTRNEPKYQELDLYRRSGGHQQQQGNINPTSQQSPHSQPGQSQPAPPNQGQLGSDPHWQQAQANPLPYHAPGGAQPAQGQSYYPPPPPLPNQGGHPTSTAGTQQQQPQWQSQPQQPSGQSYYPPSTNLEHQQHPSYPGYPNQEAGQYYPPPPPGPAPSQSATHNPGQYTAPNYGSQYDSTHYGTPSSNTAQAPYFPPPPGQTPQSQTQTRGIYDDEGDASRGVVGGDQTSYSGSGRSTTENVLSDVRSIGHSLRGQLAGQVHQYQDKYITNLGRTYGNQICQVVRSASKWSSGIPTEHSVQDAYIGAIHNSRHFVYIENQFFITATGDLQKPIQNKIGAAIVERILRAARAGQKYKVIVVIPSVPGFAGDLRDDSSLGTRAIMEYQYNSINRGGNSIMELIAKEGFNPMDYIRFYNLRNYDRINTNSTMVQAERASGVNYEDARRYHDAAEVGYGGYTTGAAPPAPTAPGPVKGYDTTQAYNQYQQAANAHPSATSGRWDSVSECYMLGGQDIRKVPWESDLPEIDAFISEELYIHSKVRHQLFLLNYSSKSRVTTRRKHCLSHDKEGKVRVRHKKRLILSPKQRF